MNSLILKIMHRMKREERQGESRVRENFMHGSVGEVKPVRRRGFTLIELLIVVAIIGILVSLLMPSLEKARQKARTAVCLSGNKQIALAWQMYMNGNKGIGFNYVVMDVPARLIWTGYLSQYISSEGVLICPATKPVENSGNYVLGTAKSAWRERRYKTKEPWNTASYAYNINLCPKNNYAINGGYNTYKSVGEIQSTDETPVTGDSWWRAPANMANGLPRLIPANLVEPYKSDHSGNSINKFITNRHGKVTVLSFTDGHADAVTLENVYRQQWFDTYDKDQAVISP